MDTFDRICLCLGCIIVGFMIGTVVVEYTTTNRLTNKIPKDAISAGVGQYNPTNGTFEWKK